MSGQNLSTLSKTAPNPWLNRHSDNSTTEYTCHTAAMHWGYMDLGLTEAEANAKVDRFVRATCPGCINNGAFHFSLPAMRYGPIFCQGAQRITRNDLVNLHPGDVLITGHYTVPNHSMIVRQVRRADHVTVRGFNNFGTLGTGQLLRYDPTSHNITKDKYWNANDMFGINAPGVPLLVVPYATYSQALRMSLNMRY
ncbi:hypothetical protein FNJ84_09145 [Paracoccus sp. M683]|uniref:hypothetical protein n=1 Tax=Paracoccus sp. M683 TaxID=2594268 RepID=UPI00117E51E6|nr:hypothetical protein [Paracoccus sp. M683]TRW97651.1 hypothetical protein FNJ84_09145 [Paracoccus sp. M683]